MTAPTPYTSKAWLLDGPIHSLPGILHLEANLLSFLILDAGTFSDKRLRALLAAHGHPDDVSLDDPLPLFSYPVSTVERFHIPWYYFGAGAKLHIAGQTVRFSFLRPQNTVAPTYYSDALTQWMGGSGRIEVTIAEGRAAGKMWASLLK